MELVSLTRSVKLICVDFKLTKKLFFAQAYFVKSQILRRMNLIPHALISILIGLFFEPCRTLESEHLKQVR